MLVTQSYLQHFLFLLTAAFYAYTIFVVVLIVRENRDTGSTLAWILVLIGLPVVGLVIYVFFGRNWKVHSLRKKLRISALRKKSTQALYALHAAQRDRVRTTIATHPHGALLAQTLRVGQNNADVLLTYDNTVKIFQSGHAKFSRLKADIKRARSFIHMEYFIWRSDPLTEDIADALIAKARDGVEVRILYDPAGTMTTRIFHPKLFRRMRRGGVRIIPFFNALSPLKITTINYVLHRKIVIIDGHIAYTGGMNMAQEYIDGGKRFAQWRDTHMRLTGESVLALHATFAVNWEQTTKESLLDNARYFPKPLPAPPDARRVAVQTLATRPLAYWQPIAYSLLTLILSARKSVYIQSPYFIPDESLYNALKMMALSGVDVRIMVAGVPDRYLPYWAAVTYFEGLLLAGAKIYRYMDGFMHAKTVIIDGVVCTVGTTNMDIRSLRLSYENNVVILDEVTAKELTRDFVRDLASCKRFSFGNYTRIGWLAQLRNSVARLFSPLL